MVWILDWLVEAMYTLGIFNKHAKLLFLGLDNAGKTTLFGLLKLDKVLAHPPTMHPNSQALIIGNTTCQAFDLGGHQQARRLWKDYFPEVDGIVFIIDAKDRARFPEARAELEAMLAMEQLADTPFLVLGNKIDDADAVSEAELRYEIGLFPQFDDRVELFMCSIVNKQGYGAGFKWLMEKI